MIVSCFGPRWRRVFVLAVDGGCVDVRETARRDGIGAAAAAARDNRLLAELKDKENQLQQPLAVPADPRPLARLSTLLCLAARLSCRWLSDARSSVPGLQQAQLMQQAPMQQQGITAAQLHEAQAQARDADARTRHVELEQQVSANKAQVNRSLDFLTKVMDHYVSLVLGRRTPSGSCVFEPYVTQMPEGVRRPRTRET